MRLLERLLWQCTEYVARRGLGTVILVMRTKLKQNREATTSDFRFVATEIRTTAAVFVFAGKLPQLRVGLGRDNAVFPQQQ